jgi:hypothetical protein
MQLLLPPYTQKPSLESFLSFGFSFLILLYALSPFWFGSRFAFQNQTGLLTVITALSAIGGTVIPIKRIFAPGTPKTVTRLDLLLLLFLAYLLIQSLFYPTDKERILNLICLASLYFLFRQLPSRTTNIFLYLLPIMAVLQIVYAHNRLTDPWQGFSDITGSFGNTGIFGGFVAIAFVAVLGMLVHSMVAERSRSVVNNCRKLFLFILLIPLAVQLFYSESRAGWLAAIIGSAVLLLPSVFRKLKNRALASLSNRLLLSVSALLLIAGVFLSLNLYHFKKDSADGRILIWTVSSKMMMEKPVTGFGTNGFQQNYLLHQGAYSRAITPCTPSLLRSGCLLIKTKWG